MENEVNNPVVESSSTEVETHSTPEVKYIVSTKADAPNASMDRELLGNMLLNGLIDWDAAEERDKGKGPYKTTTQFSWLMEADGDPSERYQISISCNRFPNSEAKAKGTKGAVETESFKLSNRDVAVLDRCIATFKANKDIDNTIKLATIKAVHERDGRVSRKDFLIVAGLQ